MKLVAVIGLIATFALLSINCVGQGTPEDYQRWKSYDERTRNRVFRDRVQPEWINDDKFWYKVRTGTEQYRFVLVDTNKRERKPAFNHELLDEALTKTTSLKSQPQRLPLSDLQFEDDLSECRFRAGGSEWSFQLPDGPLAPVTDELKSASRGNSAGLRAFSQVKRSVNRSEDRVPIRFTNRLAEPLDIFWVMSDGGLRNYGRVAAKSTSQLSTFSGHAWLLKTLGGDAKASFVADSVSDLAVIDSETPEPKQERSRRGRRFRSVGRSTPDGTWRTEIEDHNLVLINSDTNERTVLTTDGDESDRYSNQVWWSPDSKSFVAMKVKQGTERTIHMIDSAPDDSIHAKLITIGYAKPGDELDRRRLLLVHVDDPKPILLRDGLFSNPFNITDLEWRDDSKSFTFLYNERGHQALRLIEVDAESGRPRALIDETSETFICYSGKKYLRRLEETDELIWMSERDGWNHLYLIDWQTGKVKNAITSGQWVVRGVERVDEEKRLVWARVSGIDSEQDPYHTHLIRVGFDGQGLVRLTEGDGDHDWEYTGDGRFLIDRYSRVDLPTVTNLRDAESGSLVCELEKADMTSLLETGWIPPERFVAKGRDGKTDIHGIIVRPTTFDPKKSYPVLEAIYAGPHSSFVPKRFGRYREYYAMAELGFIVVKIDGMGTSNRSKAFHDVCWKNLGDSGFPDRIAWMKAAAKDRPEMDLSRVGIWGGSAGGQSAMRALIAHGDFYHAAVADCGCHDNRVDKIWWNEQWMGWPIADHYQQQSNVTQAHRLQGDLMLIWGELDKNVDPASTMQVVDALVRANKDFEQLIMPGVGHGAAGHPYARRRQADFFVRKLWRRAPRTPLDQSP